LPNWVIALVAAGGLAAALSTAAGLLMAISSAVSHDLIKGVFNPEISEKSELLAGKVSMGVAVFVAGYLGLNPPGFAAGTVALAFGIAGSSLFPAILMGIFSKTMNSEGAIAGMVAGLTTTLVYVFAHKGILFIKGTEFVDFVGGNNGWFGIEPNAIGTIGAMHPYPHRGGRCDWPLSLERRLYLQGMPCRYSQNRKALWLVLQGFFLFACVVTTDFLFRKRSSTYGYVCLR